MRNGSSRISGQSCPGRLWREDEVEPLARELHGRCPWPSAISPSPDTRPHGHMRLPCRLSGWAGMGRDAECGAERRERAGWGCCRDANLVPACGGVVCQWRGPLLPAWKGCAGNLWCQGPAAPSGWPAASLDTSRLPARDKAAGSKGKRAPGRIGGQAGTPLPSVVSEVSNHKAPAERERRALIQAMGETARLRKHRH